ncbi:hypothetical protein QA811_41015 [Streptomyces sp. B21-102]|uniref:hypothetical protein n=1 Tax=Streptomyces sp. B21-102 TaxID=3039416 RepID=UPI002FF046E4
MTINQVTRHAVAEERIEQALDNMPSRVFSRWHDMRYGDMPPRRGLRELGEELADLTIEPGVLIPARGSGTLHHRVEHVLALSTVILSLLRTCP